MQKNLSSTLSKKNMKIIAPAKVNLHLQILGLRNDGFHELAMVMQSINLFDIIELTPNANNQISLSTDNSDLGEEKDNLVLRAAYLLSEHSGKNHIGVSINLKKNIPVGDGLAGGSSDAAATLFGLNLLWNLSYSTESLLELAAKLGSDVPFCLEGGTQFCFGRGEKLEKIENSNNSMAIILVKDPKVSVSTPWAYSKYKDNNYSNYLFSEVDFESHRIKLRNSPYFNPISALSPPLLTNDLQEIVLKEVNTVKTTIDILAKLPGSIGIAMSGSGPSCFALYPDFISAHNVWLDNKKNLKELGLESWCCELLSGGVQLEL